jgi:hypothetical protein
MRRLSAGSGVLVATRGSGGGMRQTATGSGALTSTGGGGGDGAALAT